MNEIDGANLVICLYLKKNSNFAEFEHFILVLDHALLHCYPTTDYNSSNT